MPRLTLPANGIRVRMYRQGHGDCYLLALPREGGGDPVYVLIDCGYKPGSPAFLEPGRTIGEVVDHIAEATGSHLDLVIVTHEHQDHVNGFWKETDPYFGGFQIDRAWFAWTEDPTDTLANQLRAQHHDVLVGLVEARNRLNEPALAAGEDDPAVQRLDSLLALELGGEDEVLPPAALLGASDPEKSVNKQALKLIKDKAGAAGITYLLPGQGPIALPGTAGVRAFVLGPPHDADLLSDEDPVGDEAFPRDDGGHGLTFRAAVAGGAGPGRAPFSSRHGLSLENALGGKDSFFRDHYGQPPDGPAEKPGAEVADDAAWRRIDAEWLYSAEDLAIKLNEGINNTSLVLAFELPATRKILLFVGDAQRGNWISWSRYEWPDGERTVTARDLLARTVLYKVGHHGSHNATLAGTPEHAHPNLSWMAQGEAATEFTAMINAVNAWALQVKPKPWVHPLPSIRRALEAKAQGRVFQMDIDLPGKPDNVPDEAWAEFERRATFERLYFDYDVLDE